ncbi:MAG: DUF2225 domain-containing protein [Candidatus Riflebacteria bacterium]|nr:DUF2225 domain-containing protein [Candidatus Riflebacteria bacterium]
MKFVARPKKLGIYLAFIFTFCVCTGFATSSKAVDAKCPVCDNTFKASLLMSSNNFGGCDADLCPHAMGSSPLSEAIWGCPSCNFCGYSSDFEKTFSAEKKKELKQWLKQNTKVEGKEKTNTYDAIPSYKRYEIAAELACKSNESAADIGGLYLKAAWSCRNLGLIDETHESQLILQASVSDCPVLFKAFCETAKSIKPSRNRAEEALRITQKLASSLAELKIPESQLAPSYLALGIFLRASGENQQALVWLNKCLEKDHSRQNSLVIEAIKASIVEETSYQKKAAKWLEDAIEQPDSESSNTQKLLLMLAETHKRIGNDEQAEKYFLKIFDISDLTPGIQEMARDGLVAIGSSNLPTDEKIAIIENRRIMEAIESLSDPEKGNMAARFLRDCPKRETIFPELAKRIGSADEALVANVIWAMSDKQPEAIKLQMELFEQGKQMIPVLKNLKEMGSSAPIEPLIKALAAEGASELSEQLVKTIAAIGGKTAHEALLTRAEKEFSLENIEKLTKNVPEEYSEQFFYRSLINSLATCDDMCAIAILHRIIEHSLIDGYEFGYYLVEDAGETIEFIINHHLGFSTVSERTREPQFNVPPRDYDSPFSVAKRNLKEWLEKNGKKPREEIISDGFKQAGYNILPASDPTRLKELIEGLSDSFKPVRYYSYNELAKRTGIEFKPYIGRDPEAYPIYYNEIIWLYTDWLEKNIDKLVYIEDKKMFEIKN